MSKTLMLRTLTIGVVTALLLAPVRAEAQTGSTSTVATAARMVDGPRIDRAGVSRATAAVDRTTPLRFHDRTSGAAWMIAGGATFAAGSIAGGEAGAVIMLAGGAMFIIGLLDYTR